VRMQEECKPCSSRRN